MSAIHTQTVDGLTVEVHYDEFAEHCDPRDHDNLFTFVCWHPDYALGDMQLKNGDGRGAVKNAHPQSGRFKSLEHLRRYLRLAERALIVVPLSLYEHSGITMYAGAVGDYPFDSQGWDTTHVGFAYTTEERVTELCGDGEEYRAKEWLEEAARGEVKEYASWLEGDVTCWIVRGPEGNVINSCGGYVGESEYALEEGVQHATAYAADESRDRSWAAMQGIATVTA